LYCDFVFLIDVHCFQLMMMFRRISHLKLCALFLPPFKKKITCQDVGFESWDSRVRFRIGIPSFSQNRTFNRKKRGTHAPLICVSCINFFCLVVLDVLEALSMTSRLFISCENFALGKFFRCAPGLEREWNSCWTWWSVKLKLPRTQSTSILFMTVKFHCSILLGGRAITVSFQVTK
jgi:hypothetical protein